MSSKYYYTYPDCKICGIMAEDYDEYERTGCIFCPVVLCSGLENPLKSDKKLINDRKEFLKNTHAEIGKMISNMSLYNQPFVIKPDFKLN